MLAKIKLSTVRCVHARSVSHKAEAGQHVYASDSSQRNTTTTER